MILCPEFHTRAAMTDAEFWDHVLNGPRNPRTEFEYDPDHEPIGGFTDEPCPECGALTACGYDAEGRPMIHVTEDDEA